MKLRRATEADLTPLVELQSSAYARNRDILGVEPIPLQADYRTILTTMDVWLAEQDHALHGALIVEHERDCLMIWSIATAPGAQNSGVGKAMLNAAEQMARARGLSLLRLYTGTRLTHLVAWYQRHGFIIDHIEERTDRSITHMKKQLAPAVG